MVSVVRSLGLTGVAGYEVKVECDLSDGLPTFDEYGLNILGFIREYRISIL